MLDQLNHEWRPLMDFPQPVHYYFDPQKLLDHGCRRQLYDDNQQAITSAQSLLMIMCATILHSQYFLQLVDADPRTDPHEIDVLKTILKKLGKKDWNFKADPCTHWNCTADPKRVLLKRQSLAGVVPGELADLKYLEEISYLVSLYYKMLLLRHAHDLFRNYLNGSIPAVLGSLTHLKNLSLGLNRLSGEIPKELANLKNLTSLVLISNNLFGRLPLELGKLEKLERL
eukprot:Gb_02001 [translate_table: standard]